jgi:hypothetical protein
MPYLRYKLRSAGLGVPRSVVVEGETARFCSDVADELRREFPDASISSKWNREKEADLYVYVVERPPAKVAKRALRRMAGQSHLLILDARSRVVQVVSKNCWMKWRRRVALDQWLAPIFRLFVRARTAR